MHFIRRTISSIWESFTFGISGILEKCQPAILEYIILYNEFKLQFSAKYKNARETNKFIGALHSFLYAFYKKIEYGFIKVHDHFSYNWKIPKKGSWQDLCLHYVNLENPQDWFMSVFREGVIYKYQNLPGINTPFLNYSSIESFYINHDVRGYYHIGVNLGNDIYLPKINFDTVAVSESRVKFILVEYSNPDMDYRVEIKLDPKMLLVGNAILSPCFVWRYLSMIPVYKQIVFNLNYKLTIIDNMANTVELRANQYIVLNKFDYTICQINKRQ